MANFYDDTIQGWLRNPGTYQGSAGYAFSRDQGLQAAQRGMSAQRGSGNILAELTRLGSGYAAQDLGNQIERLGRLSGQEQQFQIGSEQNRNQFSLGQAQNENTRRQGDQQFGLGMYRAGNDFALGQGQNANTAMNSWWNYDLGRQRNAMDADNNRWNQFGQAQNWFTRG